jgi:hypothetical protein
VNTSTGPPCERCGRCYLQIIHYTGSKLSCFTDAGLAALDRLKLLKLLIKNRGGGGER